MSLETGENMETSKYRKDGKDYLEWTFDSFGEFVEFGKPHRSQHACSDTRSDLKTFAHATWNEVDEYVEHGWAAGVTEALPIAEQALQLIESDHALVNQWEIEWGVTGSQPDVGRYLQGMPDDMMEFVPFQVSKAGKVVTLCASFIYSYGVSVDEILRRGAMVVGLAMALEQSQHSVEIWIDHTSARNGTVASTKVLLKKPEDTVDPARLAYQLAHPSILRKIMFSAEFNYPPRFIKAQEVPGAMGMPTKPLETLPDGTIYIDQMYAGDPRLQHPEEFVLGKLRELGLLVEEEEG